MEDIIKKLRDIANNEKVQNAFFNLYDRWRDESEYENIDDYGKAIVGTMQTEFPSYGIDFVSSTRKPFGVKISMGGHRFHYIVKIKGQYLTMSCKEC